MFLKHSIQALFTLVPLALAGPITRRNANEAVVLANCASSWENGHLRWHTTQLGAHHHLELRRPQQ
jgi:hypothetical protein